MFILHLKKNKSDGIFIDSRTLYGRNFNISSLLNMHTVLPSLLRGCPYNTLTLLYQHVM